MNFLKIIIITAIGLGLLFAPDMFLNGESAPTLNAKDTFYDGKVLSNFVTSLFAGSGVCATCHDNLTDSTGADVSIATHWRSTMMANSAKDPLWQAKVSSEVDRNPHLAGVIEEKCSKCHMPMANNQAHHDGSSTDILGSGFLSSNNKLHEAAMDGVACTLCHQITANSNGQPESFSGGYDIDQTTVKPNRAIYGPYTAPNTNAMLNISSYLATHSNHVNNSELCATCHTLYTPYVNARGEVLGTFPEQTPYLEWEESNFANSTSCQGCHMPKASGSVIISTIGVGRGWRWQRSPFFQHFFVGGNKYMLEVLKESAETLGLTASTQEIEDTIERVLDQMQKNTASIRISSAKRSGDTLNVTVKVVNKAGHKFPTGIPTRRAWIELTVVDSLGKTIFSSGAPGKDGQIEGNDADENAGNFEPHYKEISRESQVQIYEAIMGNSDGEVTYTLLRAAEYLKDNRLLPKGFNKKSVDADVAVYGNADSDASFRGGSDKTYYKIDISKATGKVSVTAKLHFQSVSYRFIEDLLDSKTKEVRTFKTLMKKVGNLPVLIDDAIKTK